MTDIQESIPRNKIYKDKFMYGVGYLGGPLAAGYIIAENFKAFGDIEKYKRTWLITILSTIFIFTAVLLIPESIKIPNFVIPIFYCAIAYWLMRQYQGKQIDEHISAGGPTYSGWRAFLVGLIAITLTLAVFLPISLLIIPDEKTEIFYKKYGNRTHQIQFNSSNLDKVEVALLTDKLGEMEYLDSTYSMTLFVDKDGKEIQIWVPFSEPAWTYPLDVKRHNELKEILSEKYPDNKIIVNLCDTNWTIKKTIK